MAVRGEFTNDAGDEFTYEVVQYKMRGNSRVYKGRSANYDKLDSRDIDWARFQVRRKDGDGDGLYTQMWGPYLSRSTVEGELSVTMDDENYLEAVG